MNHQQQFDQLIKKVQQLKASGKIDLSRQEDLSIAVMNLVSLEEHFFFTAEKTGKEHYFDMLKEVRELRKQLLARLMPENEGETWCISKHLLAATMRLIEVGTKEQADGKKDEAKKLFAHAYKLYSLFWGVRLGLVDLSEAHTVDKNKPWKLTDLVNKLVDCCEE